MNPTYEALQAENIALKAENIALKKEVVDLKKEVADLKTLVEKLLNRIADLESQLKTNSKNSSKPPSSDQKANLPPTPRREKRPFH